MKSFDFLWKMLDEHGVIERMKGEAAALWDTYNLEQQRHIYRSIRDNIRAGKFVNYNPVKAIRDNAPKPPRYQIWTADKYYEHYGTQENKDGWRRVFLKDQQRTIYVKLKIED